VKRLALALAVVAVLTGCSGASNSGGDTKCADFLAMRTQDQDATVAKLLKGRYGKNSSTGDVMSKRAAIAELCATGDRQDIKIGDLG
jgi:acid stress chaperone HdeA